MAFSLPATQRVLCSKCARPWPSTEYKTCDECRRKAALRRRIPSRQPASANPQLSAHTPLPILNSSNARPSSGRQFCSGCARPWRSLQYRTCDGCRAKSARSRQLASHQSAPSNRQQSPSLQPPSLTATADASAHGGLCSSCARPWHSVQFRTCDVVQMRRSYVTSLLTRLELPPLTDATTYLDRLNHSILSIPKPSSLCPFFPILWKQNLPPNGRHRYRTSPALYILKECWKLCIPVR